jgi:hypothetical protein
MLPDPFRRERRRAHRSARVGSLRELSVGLATCRRDIGRVCHCMTSVPCEGSLRASFDRLTKRKVATRESPTEQLANLEHDKATGGGVDD